LDTLKKRINETFFNKEKKTYARGNQVQMAFALLTDIVPVAYQPSVKEQFWKAMQQTPYLDMGSSGLPVLMKYLTEKENGSEYLNKYLSLETEPSFGYFLARGENTWPEYWNVDVPSRIHTCFTGVASWFQKSLAGIQSDPNHPGYRQFIIKPVLIDSITFVESEVTSAYGKIAVNWKRSGDVLNLTVKIPANSSATVYVPAKGINDLTESGLNIKKAKGVRFLKMENDYAVFKVESGEYHFLSAIHQVERAQPGS
jgi:alpha-L-rhamnosidase